MSKGQSVHAKKKQSIEIEWQHLNEEPTITITTMKMKTTTTTTNDVISPLKK